MEASEAAAREGTARPGDAQGDRLTMDEAVNAAKKDGTWNESYGYEYVDEQGWASVDSQGRVLQHGGVSSDDFHGFGGDIIPVDAVTAGKNNITTFYSGATKGEYGGFLTEIDKPRQFMTVTPLQKALIVVGHEAWHQSNGGGHENTADISGYQFCKRVGGC